MTTILELERFASLRFADSLIPPVNMTVGREEVVSLSGPSGCGKTLLMRAVADLDPSVGRAVLDGKDRNQYAGPEWRRRVAYVATDSAWWTARVADHFASPPHGDALEYLGLAPTILTRNTSSLSTGERQRLALLRALSTAPRILLLDEPTASLDHETAIRLESLVRDWIRTSGGGVLWVCHDLNQRARIANRAFEVDKTRLRELAEVERPWALSR